MTNYFFLAGEASGDLHASWLLKALSKVDTAGHFSGIGGPRMRQEQFDCFLPMENFQIMGLSDVLKSLPKLWKLFYKIKEFILDKKPDCVILIDYPGFNLRLAKALRQSGYCGRLVQYICPSVWAHGKNRIKTLSSFYDLLLTIYPFESSYFENTGLKVKYVGNPLIETLKNHPYQTDWKKKIGMPQNIDLISLFPGSRLGEVQRHAPKQLQAAYELKDNFSNTAFAISCAHTGLETPLRSIIQKGPFKLNENLFFVPPQYHYDLMKASRSALAKSGTITLELALHGIPTVAHYELTYLNHLFAKYLLRLKLPHYCIVNILSCQRVFPELIGKTITSPDLRSALESIHLDGKNRQRISDACAQLKNHLGCSPSHELAAKSIVETLRC